MEKFLIFLRGINVGGNNRVPMKQLAECLTRLGFEKVKTHNNTGNIYLKTDREEIKLFLEEELKKEFGFEIGVIVRRYGEVEGLVGENPFKGEWPKKDTSWNVSFLESRSRHIFSEKQVILQTDTEIFWLHKKGGHDSPFEKSFEKKIGALVTTRTWGTVVKCVEMAKA